MTNKNTTELELVILGAFHKGWGKTAYAVAKEFASSPSSHWSGSVGAIYPAVERLTRRGYLRKDAKAANERSQTYTLTRKGRDALRRWLARPLDEWEAQMSHDAVRTKVVFMSLLSRDERRRFFSDARAKVEAQLPVLQRELENLRQEGDEWDLIACRGMISTMRARIRWLAGIEKELSSE